MKYIHHFVQSIIIFVLVGVCLAKGDPQFAELIRNVTVTLGREAVLSCAVDNLAEYKVGWLRVEDQTILSLHHRVVTHNPRVAVTTRVSVSSSHQSRTWNLLHIRQIKESDQGCYVCQINTLVMKKQLGCIQVQVPPNIIDDESDVSVNEGDNVTLTCKATGKPDPRIAWRREDGQNMIAINPKWNATYFISNSSHFHHPYKGVKEREVDEERGENLRLYGVTRRMMAVYLCIASNGVLPTVSKRVALNVNFAPLVTTTTNKIAYSLLGIEIRLTCQIESHPPSLNAWMKRDQSNHITTISPSAKYNIEDERLNRSRPSNYKTNSTLTIRNIQPEDIRSVYTCVAVNFMGQTEASIQLDAGTTTIQAPTTKYPTVSSSVFNSQHSNSDLINKDEDNSINFHAGSVNGHDKASTQSTNKKKHWHRHKEQHQENTSRPIDQHLKREKLPNSAGHEKSAPVNTNQQLFSDAKGRSSFSIFISPFLMIFVILLHQFWCILYAM